MNHPAPAAVLASGATAQAWSPHRVWRHRFACFQVCATWLLLVAGASVTSHDAGLAVPDWPRSFGWLNPFAVPLVGNVFYEHGHRMVAGFVGILTLIESCWIWWTAERPAHKQLAVWLSGLVLVQAVLGGITVRLFLPPIVSVSHGMLAQTFFCLSIVTAYVLSREWQTTAARPVAARRPLARVALFAAGAVYLQLLLGAFVRHHWKKEMPDDAFPARFADLLPPFAGPPVNRALAQAILAHGAFAAVVLVALVAAAALVRARHRAERQLLRPAILLVLLVLVQVGLGLLTFATRTDPDVTTAHVITGATILGVATLLVLRAWRAPR